MEERSPDANGVLSASYDGTPRSATNLWDGFSATGSEDHRAVIGSQADVPRQCTRSANVIPALTVHRKNNTT
jgi:hypothetical protein